MTYFFYKETNTAHNVQGHRLGKWVYQFKIMCKTALVKKFDN